MRKELAEFPSIIDLCLSDDLRNITHVRVGKDIRHKGFHVSFGEVLRLADDEEDLANGLTGGLNVEVCSTGTLLYLPCYVEGDFVRCTDDKRRNNKREDGKHLTTNIDGEGYSNVKEKTLQRLRGVCIVDDDRVKFNEGGGECSGVGEYTCIGENVLNYLRPIPRSDTIYTRVFELRFPLEGKS